MKEIIAVNGLRPPFTLYVGQFLRLPGQAVHVVQRGETVYSIARQHGVDMKRLARENGVGSDYMIRVGQRLTLPGASPTPAVQPDYPQNTQVANIPVPVQKPSSQPVYGVAAPDVYQGETRTTGEGQQILVPPPTTQPATAPVSSPPSTPVVARGPVPGAPAMAGAFAWPLQGAILSNYGPTSKGQHNDGINIAAPAGTPIKASESGVVVYAGNEIRGFGNLILLKHEGGLMTAYAHNEVLLVGRGAVVRRGQDIARVGNSGGVSQPQLHFEIRKNGKAVDPNPYLVGQRVAMR
jgi:murein DD-endopeptidase MepM/ murein hydrolase activator NlpD